MLSGGFDGLDLDFEVLIREEFSPAARSRALASFAREQLGAAQGVNQAALGFVPRHQTMVDGVAGADEDRVRPDGVIAYEFELLGELFAFVAEQLRTHAPVLSGRFRESFEFYADGELADPAGEIPPAKEYVFLSPLSYAHKLEQGASRQAPDGVFQAVAAIAAQRFGNQALIRFVYRAPIGGRLVTGRAGGREEFRVPSISIGMRG